MSKAPAEGLKPEDLKILKKDLRAINHFDFEHIDANLEGLNLFNLGAIIFPLPPVYSARNAIVSAPRTGSSLVRCFMEALLGRPTINFHDSNEPVYMSSGPSNFGRDKCFYKVHVVNELLPDDFGADHLVLVVRDPYEGALSHAVKLRTHYSRSKLVFVLTQYFWSLRSVYDFYAQHRGRKLRVVYEDINNNHLLLIRQLANFLQCDDERREDVARRAPEIAKAGLRSYAVNVCFGTVSSIKSGKYFEQLQQHLQLLVKDLVRAILPSQNYPELYSLYPHLR